MNNSEMKIVHGNSGLKMQFCLWSLLIKGVFCIFIYNFAIQSNWQLHYLRTLLHEYQRRPTVKTIEQNCVFKGYEDESMDLVQFYFAGTRGFKLGYDGSLIMASDIGYEDGMGEEVSEITPLLVDGWDNRKLKGVEHICLHY